MCVIDHEQKLPLRGMLRGGEKKMRKRGERGGVGLLPWGCKMQKEEKRVNKFTYSFKSSELGRGFFFKLNFIYLILFERVKKVVTDLPKFLSGQKKNGS